MMEAARIIVQSSAWCEAGFAAHLLYVWASQTFLEGVRLDQIPLSRLPVGDIGAISLRLRAHSLYAESSRRRAVASQVCSL